MSNPTPKKRGRRVPTGWTHIHIRVPEVMRPTLDQAAAANSRTVRQQVDWYVREGLRRDGYL